MNQHSQGLARLALRVAPLACLRWGQWCSALDFANGRASVLYLAPALRRAQRNSTD